MQENAPVVLTLTEATVRFGAFTAVDGVSLTLRAGEIRAVLGENGAGKSTLMNVLAGLVAPASGLISVFGETMRALDPDRALRLGIGMVHQHFMLAQTLTVAENLCLGLPRTGRFLPDLRRAGAEIAALARRYGFEVDPDARVETLSVSAQQRVEILKALYRGAKILILDEPTAVLTPEETQGLFAMARALAEQGTAILFISHKLNEIMALCDSVTVLRRGRKVGEMAIAEATPADLSRLMVGAEIPALARPEQAPGPDLLTPDLLTPDLLTPDLLTIEGLDLGRGPTGLTLRAGEVMGLAGVDGSGQVALVEAVMGLGPRRPGRIALAGEDIAPLDAAGRLARGLAHIPEDRHKRGMIAQMSVADNLVLDRVGRAPFSRRGWLDPRAIAAEAARAMRAFDIRARSAEQPIGALSGGNQQKVVLARALAGDPRAILAVYPTRGLDLGATRFVHRQLLAHRDRGAAVLLVSAELDELLALSDRIAVMFDGRVAGVLEGARISVANIGLMMAGEAA